MSMKNFNGRTNAENPSGAADPPKEERKIPSMDAGQFLSGPT